MRKSVILLVALSIVLLVGGMASAKYNIKFGNANEPSHHHTKAALKFAELIEEKTNGEITVDVYPASQLGTEDELISLVTKGTIQMCTVSPGHVGNFVKEYNVFLAPYIWRNFDHLKTTTEGPIGQELAAKAEADMGVVILDTLWVNGWRHLTTDNTPVYGPEDLKGVKIRAPQAAIYLAAVKAMGANPVPVEFSELYMALQQGVVEGEENAYGTVDAKKFYEVQNYIMETGHILQSQILMMNKKYFDKLPANLQAIVKETAKEAGVWNNKYEAEAVEAAKAKFKELGLTIITTSEIDIEAMRQNAKDLLPELKEEGIWGNNDLYERISAVQ